MHQKWHRNRAIWWLQIRINMQCLVVRGAHSSCDSWHRGTVVYMRAELTNVHNLLYKLLQMLCALSSRSIDICTCYLPSQYF